MSIEHDVSRAVQPSSRRVRVEEMDGGLELSYRRRLWATTGFLLVWWTGWTAGTTLILGKALTEPSVPIVLGAIPFVVSWLFVLCLILWMLFGVQRMRLDSEGLEYRSAVFVTLSRRVVPRSELKGVSAGVTAYQENDKNLPCLTFETMGQPLQFAPGIGEQEQCWLVEQLNEYLDSLGPHGTPDRGNTAAVPVRKSSRGEALRVEATLVAPPSDSRIEMRPRTDTVEFIWQGEWSLSTVARATFVALFWNGIVGIFLYQQTQDFNWFLFFFMIPHEVIGLCLLAAWLLALTAPAWRSTWTFGEREVAKRLRVADANAVILDIGWTRRFAIQPPVRLELRSRKGEKQSGSLWALFSHPGGDYTLFFLGEDGSERLALNHLTEGDARWIAGVLLRAFPSWSRSEWPISI